MIGVQARGPTVVDGVVDRHVGHAALDRYWRMEAGGDRKFKSPSPEPSPGAGETTLLTGIRQIQQLSLERPVPERRQHRGTQEGEGSVRLRREAEREEPCGRGREAFSEWAEPGGIYHQLEVWSQLSSHQELRCSFTFSEDLKSPKAASGSGRLRGRRTGRRPEEGVFQPDEEKRL